MSLTKADIEKIAHLARLNLPSQDVERYSKQLSNILHLINEMNQQNTNHITPMAHPLDLPQRLRDDQITETDLHQKFQKIAPQVEADLYLVPKVIDEA